jgi:hypothetical protein
MANAAHSNERVWILYVIEKALLDKTRIIEDQYIWKFGRCEIKVSRMCME